MKAGRRFDSTPGYQPNLGLGDELKQTTIDLIPNHSITRKIWGNDCANAIEGGPAVQIMPVSASLASRRSSPLNLPVKFDLSLDTPADLTVLIYRWPNEYQAL